MRSVDDVLVLANPDVTAALERYFTSPAPLERLKSHPNSPPATLGPGLRAHRVPSGAHVTALNRERVPFRSPAAPNSPR
jgi:hypothetical protein